VVNQAMTSTLQLRRYNGTGWENVGGVITTAAPTCGNHTISVAFDSSNAPTIAYATRPDSGPATTTVSKLVGGVWQAVGSNGGALPLSAEACDDNQSPRLVIDAADRPVVAYRGDGEVRIQRFDGTAWGKLAATAQDAFSTVFSAHDLAIDPAGTLWFALRNGSGPGEATVVRRFDTASGTWQTAGPNGGVLAETNTQGFSTLRIGFNTAGLPVVGGTIGVYDSTRSTTSTGTAVYRFDGTQWTTTGGYELPGSYVNNTLLAGFAVLGNDALMSWMNEYAIGHAAGLVQRDTASGWSGYGTGTDGQLLAYTAHAATSERGLNDSHLLVAGGSVYLAAVVPVLSSSSINTTYNVVLLKKTP
jgi:hypothetical protein